MPWSRPLQGRLDELTITSAALADNPLNDPNERPLWVYVPPGAGQEPLPTLYILHGFTGQVDMLRNRAAFRPTVVELVDEAFAADGAPPCYVVFVDGWTSVGGSQYLDSPAIGRYHTYLCEDVVRFVDERYPTRAGAAHRAITGKSSGGYGAMVNAMLRPDVFGALATHAGDALFEVCYQPEMRQAARALRDHYHGSYDAFFADFRSRPALMKDTDGALLNQWGMAAAYAGDDDGTVNLPFEPATGRLREEVWQRFLSWDPVRMVPRYADALRSLRAIWIDAGTRDEYYLDLGAEAFRRALLDIGVTDVAFQLFDATHAAIEYRYPLALRYLAERLADQ